jgi:hypothetical protein
MSFWKHVIRSVMTDARHDGYYRNYHEHPHGDDHDYRRSHHHPERTYGVSALLYPILGKLTRHKNRLLYGLLAVLGIVAALFVLLIVLLFPLISRLFDFLYTNGIEGALKAIYPILDQLWKGAGK